MAARLSSEARACVRWSSARGARWASYFATRKSSAKLAKIFQDDWDAIERASQQPAQQPAMHEEVADPAKVAKKVAKAITKDLPPVAPVLRVVVRELVGENGEMELDTAVMVEARSRERGGEGSGSRRGGNRRGTERRPKRRPSRRHTSCRPLRVCHPGVRGAHHGDQPGRWSTGATIQSGQRSPAGHRLFRGPSRSENSRAARHLRNLGPSRLVAPSRIQRVAYPGGHAGHLRLSQREGNRRAAVPGHRYARRFPSPLSPARSKCWRPTKFTSGSRPRASTRPLPRSPAPFSISIATEKWDWPMASWSRRRTIRPKMAASNTIPRTADRPPATSPVSFRTRANELLENGLDGVKRILFSKALHASTTETHDFIAEYVADLSQVIDFDVHSRREVESGRRSAGWRGRALLGAHPRSIRIELDRRERDRRSHLPLHDARLGWPHPHGSVVSLRHAPT